jgi:hypothetical protein
MFLARPIASIVAGPLMERLRRNEIAGQIGAQAASVKKNRPLIA